GGQACVVEVFAVREQRRAAPGGEGGPGQDVAGEARALDHHPQVEALRVGQVPRLDPRRIGRVRAGQGDAPAAARTQEAGVQGEAVAGQPVAAVVVEHRRDRKSTRLNSSHVKISYA